MAEDDSQPRFFAYLAVTFAMLMLVRHTRQMFFGWGCAGSLPIC